MLLSTLFLDICFLFHIKTTQNSSEMNTTHFIAGLSIQNAQCEKNHHVCRCLLLVGYLKTLLEVDGGINNKYMRSDTVMKCHILAVL